MIVDTSMNGRITLRRDDGAPVAHIGELPDSSMGIWIANEKRRVFAMDIVVRHFRRTKASLKKIMMERSK